MLLPTVKTPAFPQQRAHKRIDVLASAVFHRSKVSESTRSIRVPHGPGCRWVTCAAGCCPGQGQTDCQSCSVRFRGGSCSSPVEVPRNLRASGGPRRTLARRVDKWDGTASSLSHASMRCFRASRSLCRQGAARPGAASSTSWIRYRKPYGPPGTPAVGHRESAQSSSVTVTSQHWRG